MGIIVTLKTNVTWFKCNTYSSVEKRIQELKKILKNPVMQILLYQFIEMSPWIEFENLDCM